MVERRGSIPEITWEPWDTTKPLGASQPRYSLRNIADGKFDSYIRTWARTLAAYGGEVQLRFAQEMNGDWYPWGRGTNGNTPAEFVKAWRHVHDIFTAAGATNVQWVWRPRVRGAAPVLPGRSVREQGRRDLLERWQGRVLGRMAELCLRLWQLRS